MSRWLTAEREQWRGCAETFRKYAFAVFKAAFLGMFLCHALFLFYGYTSPDGTNEGLFYYWNQNWALSIGRWMMRYLSAAGCNVVMPAIFLAFNAACTAVAMLLLADLWHIESKPLLILSTVSLVVAPSVIEQHLVIYMAYVYGFSLLMTALASYLVLAKKGCPSFVVAVLALACGMGGYQAWIGFATGVIVMTLMLDCLQERPLPDIFRRAGKALAMGLLGAAVYFAVLQFEIHRYNIELSDKGGLSGFGAGSFLSGLGSKILQAYRDFKDYFTSGPNHTGKMLLVILLGTAVLLFLGWLRLVRRRKPQAILLAALGLLLPLAINIVDVLIEGNINVLMSHPMQLMVPFALVLAEQTRGCDAWEKLARVGAGGGGRRAVLALHRHGLCVLPHRCAGLRVRRHAVHRHSDPRLQQHRLHLRYPRTDRWSARRERGAEVQLPVRQERLHKEHGLLGWPRGRAGQLEALSVRLSRRLDRRSGH